MKKQITCPVCEGRGYVSWINNTETSCGSVSKTCPHCNGTRWVEVDFTNADHIRSMTDEELAEFLDSVYCHGWSKGANNIFDDDPYYHDWIKQPYREKGQNE